MGVYLPEDIENKGLNVATAILRENAISIMLGVDRFGKIVDTGYLLENLNSMINVCKYIDSKMEKQ